MQGIFQKENTDKALKYGIYRHLPTYEKIIRNLVSFYFKNLSIIILPDSVIKGIDAIYDIREGVRSASLNLYSRYVVQIQTPMVYGDDKVVVEVKIPEEIVDTFAIGPHLKGVATYLLKQCNGRYDNYLVGKRLLSYTEIAAPDASENKFRMEDRLEAVSKFAKLLERSDEEAMDAISKILMTITEVTQNDITSI